MGKKKKAAVKNIVLNSLTFSKVDRKIEKVTSMTNLSSKRIQNTSQKKEWHEIQSKIRRSNELL